MAGGAGDQHRLEVELDESVVVVGRWHLDDGALVDELAGHGAAQLRIVDHPARPVT